MTQKKIFTVFYSWQSDLSSETNKKAIATCLKSALLKIEQNKDSIELKFDEATRDEAGSPDIPSTIFKKISNADVFVCDITTINSEDTLGRKTPNPNVLIELGYAISELGWERIIVLFNKEFGNFPSDLPFDLDKRRATPFTIKGKEDTNGKGDLISKLTSAIEMIMKKNPLKASKNKNQSIEEIQREKNVQNLSKILSFIHLGTIDMFINCLPMKIIDQIDFYWNNFKGYYESSNFFLYDKDAKEHLESFKVLWEKILKYKRFFQYDPIRDIMYFYIPGDIFPNKEAEKAFYSLSKDALKLEEIFKKLIIHIRENYIEIDIDELSQKAFQSYIDFEKEIEERFGK